MPPSSSRSPLPKRAPRLTRLRKRFPAKGSKNSPLRSLVLARAGGRTSGGALPGGRLTRPLGAVVTLLLLGISVRTFLNQRLPLANQIERAARSQYIPQLEKKLGQKIEVGQFSTDWLGRVHVENIVVGRNSALPTGALIQARSATLSLDIIGLALGRTSFPDAVTAVDLDAPQLYLARDAKGKINLASLIPSSPNSSPSTRWTGRIGFDHARVFYRDELVRNRQNLPLRLDTREVNGQVNVLAPQSDTSAFEFNGRVAQALLIGTNGPSELGAFPLRGRVASQTKHPTRGWIETQTPALSAPLLASWIRSSPVQAQGGTVGGKLQVAFVGNQLAPRGTVSLQRVALLVPRPKAPPVAVSELSGPLGFIGTAFETPGLSGRVAGALWNAKGSAALGQNGAPPTFDGNLSTRDLPLQSVRTLLPANTLPPQLSTQSVGLDARVSGTTSNLRANGTLNARGASWSDAQGRRAAFPMVQATGVVALNAGQPLQLATRFEAMSGEVALPVPQLQQVRWSALRWSGTIRGANRVWNVDARADDWKGSATRGGQTQGQSAHIVASNDGANANWRGGLDVARATTSGLRLADVFPAARAVASSGELNGRARFALSGTDLSKARVAGTVSLSSLALSPGVIPANSRIQIARALGDANALTPYLQAHNLQADVSLGEGVLRVSSAQAQTLAGPLRGALQTPLARLAPQFWVAAPALRVPPQTLARLAAARGVNLRGNWDGRGALRAQSQSGRTALDAVLSLTAPTFEAADARGGARIQGRNAVLNLAAGLGAARPRWTASLRCDALSAKSGALGSTGVVLPPTLSGTRAAGVQLVATSVAPDQRLEAAQLPSPAPAGSALASSSTQPGDLFDGTEARRMFGSSVCASRRNVALPSRSAPGTSAWTMSVFAQRVAVPVAQLKGRPIITVRDVSAIGNSTRGGLTLPRVGFGWGTSGRVDGALQLQGGALGGQLLARAVEASALQALLGQVGPHAPRLQGQLNARVTLSPGQPTRIEAQMASGSVALPSTNGARAVLLPLRAFSLGAQADGSEVRVGSASGFVGGARVEGEGVAGLSSGQIGARLRLAGVSVAPYAALLGAPPLAGLVRAALRVRLDLKRSQGEVSGQAHLDGGAWRGVSLAQSDAQVGATWKGNSHSVALELTHWSGRLEGAPFSGSASLDTGRNSWSADLAATGVSLLRLARVNARLKNASATTDELSRLTPSVEGVAGGQLSLRGTLFGSDGRTLSPRPQSGFARVSVPRLGYQAKTLGALDGTFNLANGRVEFAPLVLRPVEGEEAGAPSLSLVGSAPLSRNGGPLDARLSVGEAPLDFFAGSLLQTRDALASTGFDSPFLDSAAAYVANLPRGLQGRVALEATLSGTFAAPVVNVSRLTLRGGRAPLPLGGLSLPATLDAAFTLRKGEVTFDNAQFRLAKTERDPSKTPVAGASPPNEEASTSDDDDDTLVQVQSGARLSLSGESSLVADVLNANLSQLAPWVPALRGANGEALLRGQLEGFTVRIEGPVSDPRVTGSVEAQNIAFRGRSIERLRVARFDIGGGLAKIEPGNLTVKEGRFESSAASGSVAWDWKRFGPVPDGPLALQFPLATRDFGALAALFVPQLQNAGADEFSGMVEVGGTLSAPQFSGNVQLKNAAFRLASSPATPLALAVNRLSGALRFQNGNRLVIDPADPIRGNLVSPQALDAKSKSSVKNAKAKTAAPSTVPLGATGAFGMRGAVTLAGADLPQILADLPSALAQNVYDLRLDLSKGALDAPPSSGLRDVAFVADLKTENPGDASNSQTVRWMAAARGQSLNRKTGAGELLSRGAFRLRSDFASGFASLSRSTPLAWTPPPVSPETGDFLDSDAARRLKDADFLSPRPQLVLRAFAARATGYGSGVVDGRLFLDKSAARSPDQSPTARIQTASVVQRKGGRLFGSWPDGDAALIRPLSPNRMDVAPLLTAEEDSDSSDLPLRLGGDLTVSDAQIVGGGSGEGGGVTRLSLLPDAPRLDVRLNLGRSVELVNSTLRARLNGNLSVSGTPSDPLLLGTVTLLDGQVRFPNARARVEEGTVNINVARDVQTDAPRIRLDVDALARGQSGRYTVTLRLHGPLNFDARGSQNNSNFQIDVSSDPPLSQDEAFAQLLGIAPRDFTNENGSVNVAQANQAYAQAVLQLVSAPFFSGVERSVAQALGLSSVSFEYRFNEPLAFELSKALGDRIVVSYRRTLGATQLSAGKIPYELRIDYRLRGDYYLGLKTDERNVRTLTLQKSFRF